MANDSDVSWSILKLKTDMKVRQKCVTPSLTLEKRILKRVKQKQTNKNGTD